MHAVSCQSRSELDPNQLRARGSPTACLRPCQADPHRCQRSPTCMLAHCPEVMRMNCST